MLYARLADDTPIVLDTIPSASGPERYRQADEMGQVFEPIAAGLSVSALPLHRTTCPYQDADVGGGRALAARAERDWNHG